MRDEQVKKHKTKDALQEDNNSSSNIEWGDKSSKFDRPWLINQSFPCDSIPSRDVCIRYMLWHTIRRRNGPFILSLANNCIANNLIGIYMPSTRLLEKVILWFTHSFAISVQCRSDCLNRMKMDSHLQSWFINLDICTHLPMQPKSNASPLEMVDWRLVIGVDFLIWSIFIVSLDWMQLQFSLSLSLSLTLLTMRPISTWQKCRTCPKFILNKIYDGTKWNEKAELMHAVSCVPSTMGQTKARVYINRPWQSHQPEKYERKNKE